MPGPSLGNADAKQGLCLCRSPRQRGSSMHSPSQSPASTASSSIPCVLFLSTDTSLTSNSPVCPTGTAQQLSSKSCPASCDPDMPQSHRRSLPPHSLLSRRRVSPSRLSQPQPQPQRRHASRPVGIPTILVSTHSPCSPCPLQTCTLTPRRRTLARQPFQSGPRST